MPGKFEGLSGAEWELFADIFPEKAGKGRGMPAAHPRNILNSLLFIHRLPVARSSAKQAMGIKKFSSSRRRLKAWHSDGRLEELQARLPGAARNAGQICWKSRLF